MKRTYFCCLFLCLTTTFSLAQSPTPLINPNISAQKDPKAQAKILDSYGKLPLRFEANHGQTDAQVKFLSRTSGYSLFLTGDEAVLTLSGKNPQGFVSGHRFSDAASGSRKGVPSAAELTTGKVTSKVLRMKLRNANSAARVTGVDELAGTSNYFIGNDPAKWRTNVPTYAKVKYEGIYSGIDLVYYGNQRQLEYDFIVAPGADPHRIAFDVHGAKRIRQDGRGELVFKVGADEIRWHRPVVYQEKDGARQSVAARYVISDTNRVGFEVAKYDDRRPLYIDPLIYSTYLGGSGADYSYGIAVDSSGNAYVTGVTSSTDFPTKDPLQTAKAGGNDVFVTKINAAGSALVYSTYLGGSGDDVGSAIAVDSSGNAYVTGTTYSTDFPTMNPLQPANAGGGSDAFVSKINASGSALVYSTYLGGSGSDYGAGIAVDSASNAYVIGTTYSTDFPTTSGAFQTACGDAGCLKPDAFVAKINPAGSALVYSTYLGGSSYEDGRGIAVDSAGNAYVTGFTYSNDFPTTSGAFQTACGDAGCFYGNAFVAKINPIGSALVYSTYLGGSGSDGGAGIAVDSAGHAYVTGRAGSADFPTKNPLQAYGGDVDAFVAKINATGSALVYSTYLGGSGVDDYLVGAIAVDSAGNAYVTGDTGSTDFPTTPGAFKTTCGRCANYEDAFVAKIDPTGSVLVYSTYLGGSGHDTGVRIAVDSSRNAYVTGYTTSTDFPTKNPLQPVFGGGFDDTFVVKMDVRAVPMITLSSSLNPSIYGQEVTFTAVVTSTIGPPPNGETITFMKGITVLGTGVLSGGSASFTTSTLPVATGEITAVYGGDVNFTGGKSKIVKQVVNKATTTTALTSSLNPSNFGQSVTFTASETPQYSGTVKGKVTFYDGTTALKTVYLSGGVAKFTTSTLAAGTHTITGTYNGSANFTGSSGSLTQQVN
jgi:Bacterial Ig-like domain (group 3)/Beta-propeller repeat